MRTLHKFGGLLLLLALLLGCGARERDVCRVRYLVTGTAGTAAVRHSVPSGGVEQRTVSVPYRSPRYKFPIGATVSVEARNQGASGDLHVQILVDGDTVPDGLVGSMTGVYTDKPHGVAHASWPVGVR